MRTFRPVLVSTGRHPFEVATLAAAALSGTTLALASISPRAAAAAMPGLVQVLWEVLLIAGGVIGLVGIFWPGRLVARLGAEAVGIALLGAGTTMYSVALFAVVGSQATAAGSFVAAIAVASWARIIEITLDLRRIAAASREGLVVDIPLLAEEQR